MSGGEGNTQRLENALLRAIGLRSCIHNWNPNTGQHCGRPAVAHILCHDGHGLMVCALHVQRWGREPHRDHHGIGGACGLPDTAWVMSKGDVAGTCVIEGLDFPDLFAVERSVVRR